MVFSILRAVKQFIKIIMHKCPHFTAVQIEGNSSVTYLPKSYRGKQILSHQIAGTGSLRSLSYTYWVLAKLILIYQKNKRNPRSQILNVTCFSSV